MTCQPNQKEGSRNRHVCRPGGRQTSENAAGFKSPLFQHPLLRGGGIPLFHTSTLMQGANSHSGCRGAGGEGNLVRSAGSCEGGRLPLGLPSAPLPSGRRLPHLSQRAAQSGSRWSWRPVSVERLFSMSLVQVLEAKQERSQR